MTADVELLPLPRAWDSWIANKMEAYARANVAHATKPLKAEIETLRAEVERLHKPVILSDWQKLEARAERLAEALREARDSGGYVHDVARAALRDHDQEVGNG